MAQAFFNWRAQEKKWTISKGTKTSPFIKVFDFLLRGRKKRRKNAHFSVKRETKRESVKTIQAHAKTYGQEG